MSMGRRKRERQQELWVASDDVARAPRHVFYDRVASLLSDAGFDDFIEGLCEPYYAEELGRPGIPPGVYFRMLFLGYFEGLDSQRAIAWRCEDSLSLRAFLGIALTEQTPDHSSLTRVRDRLPLEVHEQAFAFMISIAEKKKLLKGKVAAVDSTMLEADAAMKTIVRKDTGEDWKKYLKRLMQEQGLIQKGDEPTNEELQRFDRNRKDKKVSNEEWKSPTDGDARIAKMKDGRTHLAYKAEHVVDLESEFVLAATVYHADEGDADTLLPSVIAAQANLIRAGSEAKIQDVPADKGYHKNETLAELSGWGLRSYIPERKQKNRRWTDKPAEQEAAFRSNRRRVKGNRGKRLQRQRSERVERSFAHVCRTGGARRTWLHGLEKTKKRYLVAVMAHNLGLVMRKLFGIGKPKEWAAACAALTAVLWVVLAASQSLQNAITQQFRTWPRSRRLSTAPPTRPSATALLLELPA
jgi:IS5 family transposase